MTKPGINVEIDPNDLMQNCKTICGVIEGNSVPDIFIPQLVELYIEDSEKGKTIKPIIRIRNAA